MNHSTLWRIARRSRTSALITAAGVLIVVLALLYAGAMLARLQTDVAAFESRIEALNGEVEQLTAKNRQQLEHIAVAEKEAALAKKEAAAKEQEMADFRRVALASFGHKKSGSADAETLQKSMAARQMADRISQTGAERRAQIRLRYYPADFERYLDGQVVLAKLADYGFQIEKAGPRIASVPMNAMWIGESIHADDVRLILLTLMAAGADMKAVRHFRQPGGARKQLIEVGTDSSLARAPAFSPEQVMALAKFKRQR